MTFQFNKICIYTFHTKEQSKKTSPHRQTCQTSNIVKNKRKGKSQKCTKEKYCERVDHFVAWRVYYILHRFYTYMQVYAYKAHGHDRCGVASAGVATVAAGPHHGVYNSHWDDQLPQFHTTGICATSVSNHRKEEFRRGWLIDPTRNGSVFFILFCRDATSLITRTWCRGARMRAAADGVVVFSC